MYYYKGKFYSEVLERENLGFAFRHQIVACQGLVMAFAGGTRRRASKRSLGKSDFHFSSLTVFAFSFLPGCFVVKNLKLC